MQDTRNVSGPKSRRLRAGNVSGLKSRRLRAGNVSGLKSRRLCASNWIRVLKPSRLNAGDLSKIVISNVRGKPPLNMFNALSWSGMYYILLYVRLIGIES